MKMKNVETWIENEERKNVIVVFLSFPTSTLEFIPVPLY